MKVLVDNNISPKVARALNAFFHGEHDVLALRDRFPQNIKDTDLIRELSNDGPWFLISADRRITKNRAEREALQRSNVTGLFLAPSLRKATEIKKLEKILSLWDSIIQLSKIVKPGGMFELPMKGTAVRPLRV